MRERGRWWRVPVAVLATYVLGVVGAQLGGIVGGALAPADAGAWAGLGYALYGVAVGLALAVLVAAVLAFRMGLGVAFGLVTAAVAVTAVVLQPTFREAFIPLLLAAPVLGGVAALPLRWWIRVPAVVLLAGAIVAYVAAGELAQQRAHTAARAEAFAEAGVPLYAPADPDAPLKWAITNRELRMVSYNTEIGDHEYQIQLQSLATQEGVTSCTVWGRPGQLPDVWISGETDNVVCREVDGVHILVSGVPNAPLAELERVAAGMQRSTPDRFAASHVEEGPR